MFQRLVNESSRSNKPQVSSPALNMTSKSISNDLAIPAEAKNINSKNKLLHYASAARHHSAHRGLHTRPTTASEHGGDWASSSDEEDSITAAAHSPYIATEENNNEDGQPTAADTLRQEFIKQLKEPLSKVSRQRLRYTLTLLRRIGGGDGRVIQRDFTNLLQECEVILPARAIQLLLEAFTDHKGVNYEQMWIAINDVHSQTNRDSVRARRDSQARQRRPPANEIFGVNSSDATAIGLQSSKYDLLTIGDNADDAALLQQLVKNFAIALQSNDYSFGDFRDAMIEWQQQRGGSNSEALLSEYQVLQVVTRMRLPVKEQLLWQLLKRCSNQSPAKNAAQNLRRGSRTVMINANEFLQFLEKSYNLAMREVSLINRRNAEEKVRVQQLIQEADDENLVNRQQGANSNTTKTENDLISEEVMETK